MAFGTTGTGGGGLRWVVAACVALACAQLVAQGGGIEQPERRRNQPSPGAQPSAAPMADDWTIVIAAFIGPDKAERATQSLWKAKSLAGLESAFVEERGRAVVLAFGKYAGPDDPRAAADLRRVQTLIIDGQRPFADALLSPPSPDRLAGSIPQFDLRNAKKYYGSSALYTLQVGIYGPADDKRPTAQELAECRKTAEQAAAQLRREGELAFYYHGPERSTVTVGIFGTADYDPVNSPGFESLPLREARKRHPLNLLNGKGIRERVRGVPANDPKAWRMQPSSLVAVPEERR